MVWEGWHREMSPYPDYKGQASPATIATGGPMGCGSGPCARAKPLAARYITHSKFNRAPIASWLQEPARPNREPLKRIRQTLEELAFFSATAVRLRRR